MAEDLLREPLPDPWIFGVLNDGRVFFINDKDEKTTWLHPDTGRAVKSGFRQREDLSVGWEEGFIETGASYYINHNNRTTTFALPERGDELKKIRKNSKTPEEPVSQNSDSETSRQPRKKQRSASFLERSGINIFRRGSSKSREKAAEENKKRPRKMKEKRQKSEKRPKAARPTSATSVGSNQSFSGVHSKMTVSCRDPSKAAVKSGWLYKQDSTGKMRMWRKKWFVLADFYLYYYKDAKEDEILGSIILPSYTVSPMSADDRISRKYAFKVEHDGMKTYHLSADSHDDMALWIAALQKSCRLISPKLNETKKTAPKNGERTSKDTENDSKGTDGPKSKKKDVVKPKPDEDSDSEFGFNHVRVHPPATTTFSTSKDKERRKDEPVHGNLSSSNNVQRQPRSQERNSQVSGGTKRNPRSPNRQGQPATEQQNATPSKTQLNRQHVNAQRVQTTKQDPRQPSVKDPRLNRTGQRQIPNEAYMRQHPQQKDARRENGESAYFSDTSGATDSSGRFANSSDRSNPQQNHHHHHQPHQSSSGQSHSKVKRQDSLAKLGSWVMNQKMRQSGSALNSPQRVGPSSNFDTASEFSSVSQQHTRKSTISGPRGSRKMGPPPTRRYRARTYNEYMDPMEVASSTISMPPIQHMNRMMYMTQTMPRPQSTEAVDNMGRPVRRGDLGRRMVPSKSAGNMVTVDRFGGVLVSPPHSPRSEHFDAPKRSKSDYVYQNGDDLQLQYNARFKKAQSGEKLSFRPPKHQQHHRPLPDRPSDGGGGGMTLRGAQQPPRSAGTPNDVFSPRSNASSARSPRNDGQVFQFDGRNTLSPRVHAQGSYTLPPPQRTPHAEYKVKQMQRGQLRAFALSTKSMQAQLPPPERQTPLKSTENIPKAADSTASEKDIENKVKRLHETENAFRRICDDVANLRSDKERLEADLTFARSKTANLYSAVDTQQHRLEQELGNVKAQLANAAEKLKSLARQNEIFQQEIKKLKSSVVEELRSQRSPVDDVYNSSSPPDKASIKGLEWGLGRIEFIVEDLKNQNTSIANKVTELSRAGDDYGPLISPTSPSSVLSANSRSPRDVKRISGERRSFQSRPSYGSTSSGNSTPAKKYFTLPGRGVSRATSVDSVTADSLAKSSSRPSSARSVSSVASSTGNLHRTRSAAERLFNTQYGNQGSEHEAKEIKRLQREVLRNRRNNLKSGSVGDVSRRYSNPAGMTLPARSPMKVGTDVQMALKHHRMPKVLQRAKRDRAEAMNSQIGFDIDELERNVTGKQKPIVSHTLGESYRYKAVEDRMDFTRQDHAVDMESDDVPSNVNLTQQLAVPEKVEIPRRYVEYENVGFSPADENLKHEKVAAIERLLAKSGHQASLPAVHKAAALAVEAGAVARAVAMHASAPQRQPGDGQKAGHSGTGERPVTDGSSSAGEEPHTEPATLMPDHERTEECIV